MLYIKTIMFKSYKFTINYKIIFSWNHLNGITSVVELNIRFEFSWLISQDYMSMCCSGRPWDVPGDGFICQIYSCFNNLTCKKTTTLSYTFRIFRTMITNSIAWRIWASTFLLFLLINYSNHNISGWSFNYPNFKVKRLIIWYCSIWGNILSPTLINPNVLNNFIVIVKLKLKIANIWENFGHWV